MTIALSTWAYEQRDKLVSLQQNALWDVFHSRHCAETKAGHEINRVMQCVYKITPLYFLHNS